MIICPLWNYVLKTSCTNCYGEFIIRNKRNDVFKCPVINIGSRQKGRVQGCNVINVKANILEIEKAVKKINSDNSFIKKIRSTKNIYGDGKSAKKIIDIISKTKLDNTIINKAHYEKKI